MSLEKHILILICLTFGHSGLAQDTITLKSSDSISTWSLLKHDTRSTWNGVKHSVSRPFHWKGKDFKSLGFLVVGTASLSLIDETSNSFFIRQEQEAPGVLKDFGWYFGSPQNYFMINAGLYGFGLLTKNENIRKTSVLIISSSITTGLIQSISKSVFGRARPGSDYGPYEFKPFSSEGAFHSFPSGHTILSITMAHAIAKQFNNTWAKITIYSIGAIPPLSRLTANAHWLTDVALGAVISIIVVDCIDNFLYKEKVYNYEKNKHRISWNLTFKANQIGVVGRF